MKPIIKDTSLEEHSARKTVGKKLKTAGTKWSSIMKLTGQRNLQCLDDYDEADENKQRQLYHRISSVFNANQLSQTNIGSPSMLNRSLSLLPAPNLGGPRFSFPGAQFFQAKRPARKLHEFQFILQLSSDIWRE